MMLLPLGSDGKNVPMHLTASSPDGFYIRVLGDGREQSSFLYEQAGDILWVLRPGFSRSHPMYDWRAEPGATTGYRYRRTEKP